MFCYSVTNNVQFIRIHLLATMTQPAFPFIFASFLQRRWRDNVFMRERGATSAKRPLQIMGRTVNHYYSKHTNLQITTATQQTHNSTMRVTFGCQVSKNGAQSQPLLF